MSVESIFEHSFYCVTKSRRLFQSCKKCKNLNFLTPDEEKSFYLDSMGRHICKTHFKSLNFQTELKDDRSCILNPNPIMEWAIWLVPSLTTSTSGDDLVRKLCLTAERLFSNYFLNLHYQNLNLKDFYVRDDVWYRREIFNTARQLAVTLIMNVDFEFFIFFAQNAHPPH